MKSPLRIFFSAITLTLKASSLLQSLGGLRVAEEDFLGNQTRMNFPGNRMGDGFSWESNGGCKNNNNNNNNMIRLVPARIESGRGKEGLFRDSLVSGGQLHERAS